MILTIFQHLVYCLVFTTTAHPTDHRARNRRPVCLSTWYLPFGRGYWVPRRGDIFLRPEHPFIFTFCAISPTGFKRLCCLKRKRLRKVCPLAISMREIDHLTFVPMYFGKVPQYYLIIWTELFCRPTSTPSRFLRGLSTWPTCAFLRSGVKC